MKEQVLAAMRAAGKPVSAGEVTAALGADRKEVDKVFAERPQGSGQSVCRTEEGRCNHLARPLQMDSG